MKLLLLLLMTSTAFAGIKTNVIALEEGLTNQDNIDVLVSHDGRVYQVEPTETVLIDKLRTAEMNNLKVELKVQTGVEFSISEKIELITDVKLLESNKSFEIKNENVSVDPMIDYTPTDLESYEQANEVFQSLEEDHRRRSQCYNRAYIWSKRMHDRYNIKSMKIFIFYTKKYREEVSKKWWYHVAPMVSAGGEYFVMDREFTRTPKTTQEWEKKFTYKIRRETGISGYRCIKMDNINTYYESNNTYNEFCNIQYANMYFGGPNDLKAAARQGVVQRKWKNSKLRYAAKEGFKKWKKVYESVKVEE